MGIITENPKPRLDPKPLDDIALIRTKSDRAVAESGKTRSDDVLQTMTSGGETLTLSGRCVIHRKNVSGRGVVTMIPLRSIDSFSIQTRKSGLLLTLFITLLLAAIVGALWFFVFPLAAQILFPSSNPPSALEVSHLSSIALLVFAGLATLLAYAAYSQTELVIYSLAGHQKIRVKISKAIDETIRQFVEDIEGQIPRG